MKLQVKRVYDAPAKTDGFRVLVDRLWPRGLSKEAAKVDSWAKDIAPSHELRRWFHSDQGDFTEFRKRYRKELDANMERMRELRNEIGRRKATLLYATKADAHNHAQLVKQFLEGLD